MEEFRHLRRGKRVIASNNTGILAPLWNQRTPEEQGLDKKALLLSTHPQKRPFFTRASVSFNLNKPLVRRVPEPSTPAHFLPGTPS